MSFIPTLKPSLEEDRDYWWKHTNCKHMVAFSTDQIVDVVRETQCRWAGGTEWGDEYYFLSVDSKRMVGSIAACVIWDGFWEMCFKLGSLAIFWRFFLLLGIILELITAVHWELFYKTNTSLKSVTSWLWCLNRRQSCFFHANSIGCGSSLEKF